MNFSLMAAEDAWAHRRKEWKLSRLVMPYVVFSAPDFANDAQALQTDYPDRFRYHKIEWGKFADGTDKIVIGGFTPTNEIAGEHCIFFASFRNNDITLSQFNVLIVLLQSFIQSLTIVLPYYPVGTLIAIYLLWAWE